MKKPRLAVDLGPNLILKNPVVTASGTFGFGLEYAPFGDLAALGAVVIKSVTRHPRRGNPPPRLVETPAGVLNSIGLENPGVEKVVKEILPALRATGKVTVIGSVAGETVEEYVEVACRLAEAGVAALELNLSCPNVKAGTLFGHDPLLAAQVTRAVREALGDDFPFLVKLGVVGNDFLAVARAAVEAGATGLSLINTLPGLAVDVKRRKLLLGHGTGGLSGPAIKPVALWAVWRAHRELQVPIIGMGGVVSVEDVLAFLLCGARAVAVGSGTLAFPRLAWELVEGLEQALAKEGVEDVRELIGMVAEK
ncbi:dihydroorotate dehydrogenase family protein [Ammonifex degensii KC4]|uniref:Dihydroorotate dehydrogenase n=1 Tax=Ammonifex degensii (strain DSM 10501 / KC4) TaxID=429009 RepID=C9RBA2_AMMDK|nr:dihydroorotate dehydrogenase [Ammonifex degensii]ACX51529.1 dihydroorotate dehydrogenase family protein [Ammonifex degensii KC4]